MINQIPDRDDGVVAGAHLHVEKLMPGVFDSVDLRNVNMADAFGRFNDDFTGFTLRFGAVATYDMVVSDFRTRRTGTSATMHTIVQGNLLTLEMQTDGEFLVFDAVVVYFVDVSYRDEDRSTIRMVRRETDVLHLRRA